MHSLDKMVFEEVPKSSYSLEDLCTKEQIKEIVKKSCSVENNWKLIKSEVKSAAPDGIIGFLGEHLRAILHVEVNGSIERVQVFIKKMPCGDQGKSKYIQEFSFFERESTILNFFQKLDEIDELNPWHTKTYVCNENVIVMPDLALDGYKNTNRHEIFDLEHMLVAVASLARFHAVIANYETNKIIDTKRPYPLLEEYSHMLKEVLFVESPWIYAVAKLTNSIIEEFSQEFKCKISELEEKLTKLYVQACDSLRETDDSVNVLLHKDLWANNLMFKYNKGKPINALFVDFQAVTYGPPTFDVMVLLYMNSFKSFREQHEKKIFEHYFSTFTQSLDKATQERIKSLNYDFVKFQKWCDKSRMYALLQAMALLPYVTMASDVAQKTLNNPDKFLEYTHGDRSGPVIEYAKESSSYKKRLLEASEEFVERFVCS